MQQTTQLFKIIVLSCIFYVTTALIWQTIHDFADSRLTIHLTKAGLTKSQW